MLPRDGVALHKAEEARRSSFRTGVPGPGDTTSGQPGRVLEAESFGFANSGEKCTLAHPRATRRGQHVLSVYLDSFVE